MPRRDRSRPTPRPTRPRPAIHPRVSYHSPSTMPFWPPAPEWRMDDLTSAPFIDSKPTEGETQVWRKSFHKFSFTGRACLPARFRVMRPRMQTMVRYLRLGLRADALWRRALGKLLEAFFAGLIKPGSKSRRRAAPNSPQATGPARS